MYRSCLICLLVLLSPMTMAASAGISFSNSSAELSASTGGDYADTVDFGLTGYYNSDADILVTLDMLTALEGDGSSPWLFSLGAKAFGLLLQRQVSASTKEEQESHIGIAVAMKFGYKLLTAIPMAIVGDISYSPNILNNGKITNMTQVSGFLELMLSPSSIAQVGYRQYRTDFKSDIYHLGNNYKKFEDSIVAGIKLRF